MLPIVIKKLRTTMLYILGILFLLFIAYHYRLDQASGIGGFLLYIVILLIVICIRAAWHILT